MRLNFFVLLAASLPCATAQSTISTPALGYAYDPGLHAIRAVRGIPGAALVAGPLDPGFEAAAAAVAPSQDFALVLDMATADLRLVSWRSGSPSSTVLMHAAQPPDRFVFSRSGTAAILADSHSGGLQLVTSLPDSPDVREIQPAGTPLPNAMAAADDGVVALATGDLVRITGPGLSPFSLPFPPHVAALAFSGSTHNLLAVTDTGDVYLALNIDSGADIRKIYSGDPGTADPVAVQFSPDGSGGLVANKAGMIASIDLNSGAAAMLSCQCAPTGLEPFGRPGMFRLTGISNKPLLLFDSAANPGRLWFVPAPGKVALHSVRRLRSAQ